RTVVTAAATKPVPRWFPLLVCATAFAVYANALWDGFVWDDGNIVVHNPLIKQWAEAPHLFTAPLEPNSTYYRPLLGLSLLVDYHLFGPSPAGFHLTASSSTRPSAFYCTFWQRGFCQTPSPPCLRVCCS